MPCTSGSYKGTIVIKTNTKSKSCWQEKDDFIEFNMGNQVILSHKQFAHKYKKLVLCNIINQLLPVQKKNIHKCCKTLNP